METIFNLVPAYNLASSSTDMDVPTPKQTKIHKKKGFQRKNNHLKSKNIGHWTNFEKQLYYVFLKTYRDNFIQKELRRTDKIFKEMAKFIKTRAADQCRSHHQKMQKKHQTIDNILISMQQFENEKNYLELVKALQNEQNINVTIHSPQPSGNIQIQNKSGVQTQIQQQLPPLLSYDDIEQLQLSLNHQDQLFSDETPNIENYFIF